MQSVFEQHPPIATNFWVQKLESTLADAIPSVVNPSPTALLYPNLTRPS